MTRGFAVRRLGRAASQLVVRSRERTSDGRPRKQTMLSAESENDSASASTRVLDGDCLDATSSRRALHLKTSATEHGRQRASKTTPLGGELQKRRWRGEMMMASQIGMQ